MAKKITDKIDTTEEFALDAQGNIVKTATGSTIFSQEEFLDDLANDKIRWLERRKQVEEKIKNLQKELADEDKRISELHRLVIPKMSDDDKSALADSNLELNNKLAKAFPSDFKEKAQTVVAGAEAEPSTYEKLQAEKARKAAKGAGKK